MKEEGIEISSDAIAERMLTLEKHVTKGGKRKPKTETDLRFEAKHKLTYLSSKRAFC
ncbi:MAG: hypothetical protein AAGD11_15385 [Planctomycetota bacterium]